MYNVANHERNDELNTQCQVANNIGHMAYTSISIKQMMRHTLYALLSHDSVLPFTALKRKLYSKAISSQVQQALGDSLTAR